MIAYFGAESLTPIYNCHTNFNFFYISSYTKNMFCAILIAFLILTDQGLTFKENETVIRKHNILFYFWLKKFSLETTTNF